LAIFPTVIIPVYRDAAALERTLASTDFSTAELIVSATRDDASLSELRATRKDIVWINAPRGRAIQMNAGAAFAKGDWLVFLHADTQLPIGWTEAIEDASRDPRVAGGCFRFALDSESLMARLIEVGVRARVALLGLPYGDQAIFVRRTVFEAMGGYAQLPIMEDVDLVQRLKRRGRLFRSSKPALTSPRRWERDGWIGRSARHVLLILLYFSGVSPDRLIRLDHARQVHPDPPAGRIPLQ
jgi:rSAM/selenodomain-associated transferase 2